jgi:hypothetical protein
MGAPPIGGGKEIHMNPDKDHQEYSCDPMAPGYDEMPSPCPGIKGELWEFFQE